MSSEDDQVTPGADDDGAADRVLTVVRARTRRKRIWRRVRRTVYALVLLAIAVPVTAFVVFYQIWDVPNPDQIAAEQDQTITLYYSDGRTELTRILPRGGARTLVTFADIPAHVQNAVLSAEDNTFWTNDGFDVTGLARAAWNNLTGAAGGGSTITQQYIKKATDREDKTFARKFRELVLAKKMSDTFDKKDILTAYLNTVYFGRGANGIQAAAKAYFGKDVQALDVSEAALLAGVIQRPTFWDPEVDRDNAERRWRFVLDQMMANGWLSATDRDSAKFPTTVPREPDTTRSGPLQHIENQVLAELEDRAGIGLDEALRRGYRVVTTIDRDAQETAEKSMREVMTGQPDYLRSALVAVDPKTGGVAAYYGGSNGNGLDYAQSLQEPGTAFGPFVGLAAVSQGIGLNMPLNGESPRTIGGIPMKNPPGVTCSPCTVAEALRVSANTALAELAVKIGTGKVAEAAYRAGIPPTIRNRPTMTDGPGKDPDSRIAMGSGNVQVRPFDMATAYATVAADGMRPTPHFVERVEGISGDVFYGFAGAPEEAFDTGKAKQSAMIARSVTAALLSTPRTGRVAAGQGWTAMKPGERAYGDNGQTAKAWMIGYSRELATAVWFGADRIQPLKGKYGESGGGEHDITGTDEPAVVWKAVHGAYERTHPATPDSEIPFGRLVPPAVAGVEVQGGPGVPEDRTARPGGQQEPLQPAPPRTATSPATPQSSRPGPPTTTPEKPSGQDKPGAVPAPVGPTTSVRK